MKLSCFLASKLISRILWTILTIFVPLSNAATDCNYVQQFETGKKYHIFSDGYPNKTTYQQYCTWYGESFPNTIIVISCYDIDIPKSVNCQTDYLAISLTGDYELDDAQVFCGNTSVTLQTGSNKFRAVFNSYTAPSRFLCEATAIQASPDEPDPILPNECDCGWRHQTRIVGGEETGVNEFPAMGGLIDPLVGEVYCGATIISSYYALTAAHCLNNRIENQLGLLVGAHNVSNGASSATSQLLVITKFFIHPTFDNSTNQNDIAVIRTKTVIVFSAAVGPICLPFKFTRRSFRGDDTIALGWGYEDFFGPLSDILRKVTLQVVPNAYCQSRYNQTIYSTNVCTYADGKDTCQSDSGGPLLWQDPETLKLHLVGIVSFGFACASDKPAVNIRVTNYLSWILYVTQSNFLSIFPKKTSSVKNY